MQICDKANHSFIRRSVYHPVDAAVDAGASRMRKPLTSGSPVRRAADRAGGQAGGRAVGGNGGGACSLRGRTLPRVRRMSLEAPGRAEAGGARVLQTGQRGPRGERRRGAVGQPCAGLAPADSLPDVLVFLCATELSPSPRPVSTFLSQKEKRATFSRWKPRLRELPARTASGQEQCHLARFLGRPQGWGSPSKERAGCGVRGAEISSWGLRRRVMRTDF